MIFFNLKCLFNRVGRVSNRYIKVGWNHDVSIAIQSRSPPDMGLRWDGLDLTSAHQWDVLEHEARACDGEGTEMEASAITRVSKENKWWPLSVNDQIPNLEIQSRIKWHNKTSFILTEHAGCMLENKDLKLVSFIEFNLLTWILNWMIKNCLLLLLPQISPSFMASWSICAQSESYIDESEAKLAGGFHSYSTTFISR